MKEITDQLKGYTAALSLHVPGHHRHTIGSLHLPVEHDMTEITGLDDYHHAEDVIAKSELILSRHADYRARYLVNGTTTGILSVILAHKKLSTKRVAMMRNVHKSVLNALDLTGTEAVILPMTVSDKTNQYDGIDFDQLHINMLKKIDLVVLTYPNYFGEIFNIKEAIEWFHAHDIEVLVDEAHGAHFDITDSFPSSSIKYAGDYIVQSYHKTLPALTMGSVIHMKKQSKLVEEVYYYLSVLQTSSPSYLILSSLEQAHDFYLHYHDAVFLSQRSELIAGLKQTFDVIEVGDPLKLVIRKQGFTGEEIKALIEREQIFVELSTYDSVLLVLPLWHAGDTYPFKELVKRIERITVPERTSVFQSLILNQADGSYKPVTGQFKAVQLKEGVGCRVYHALTPYPPGIPYVLPGEVLTAGHIKVLETFENVHGIIDGNINIIDEG